MKSIKTVWEKRTYDVWGNAKDGFEVNQSFRSGEVTIHCAVNRYNIGTPREFESASPSDAQIRKAFGVRCHLETDGDDLTVYVNRKRDGYPIGELYCVSHKSLSPINGKEGAK